MVVIGQIKQRVWNQTFEKCRHGRIWWFLWTRRDNCIGKKFNHELLNTYWILFISMVDLKLSFNDWLSLKERVIVHYLSWHKLFVFQISALGLILRIYRDSHKHFKLIWDHIISNNPTNSAWVIFQIHDFTLI